MWFSLFALVLILAITFYQGLLGLFTAFINCTLTILAAALAFGLYEKVYYDQLITRQPDAGRAIAVMAIFIISLMVMRVIVDLIVKENMKFPMAVDRAGGGIFGFITAMVIIGTLSVSVQMLPFPYEWLGFSRYVMYNSNSGEAVSLTPEQETETEADMLAKLRMSEVNFVRKSLWLSPDSFTLGLVSLLSENALTGGESFGRVHPNLLDALFWQRFSQHGQKAMLARNRDAIKILTAWELPEDRLYVATAEVGGDRNTPGRQALYEPGDIETELRAGHRWLAVQAELTADASDDGTNFRFNPGQVRLVTKPEAGHNESYPLVGVNAMGENVIDPPDKFSDLHYRVYPGQTIQFPSGFINFVFEIPEDAEPWFVEFRGTARAEVPPISEETPVPRFAPGGMAEWKDRQQNKSGGGSNAQGTSGTREPAGANGRKGRISRVHSNLEGSFFGEELPFKLTNYTAEGLENRGDTITGGRVIARLDENDDPVEGTSPTLNRLSVPSGRRLLHLSVTRLQPGSLFGQVRDFAAQNNNVSVKTAGGQEYPAVGVYAIATVGSERLFELHFVSAEARMSSAGVPKLEKINRRNLRNDYEMYYLFEVPPGERVVTFVNPNRREESYESVELVAPN